MKRFFCTKCQRVRRVRKLPASLSINAGEAYSPVDRVGECDWHTSGVRILQMPKRQSVKRVTVSTPSNKVSRKRG